MADPDSPPAKIKVEDRRGRKGKENAQGRAEGNAKADSNKTGTSKYCAVQCSRHIPTLSATALQASPTSGDSSHEPLGDEYYNPDAKMLDSGVREGSSSDHPLKERYRFWVETDLGQ